MNIKSLHAKVSISVAAAAALVVVISSLWAYERAYENSFADSQRSVQQLLETVSTSAAIAAYVGNEELAQQAVEGLSINDIVVGARIVADGKVLSKEGATFTTQAPYAVTLQLAAPFDDQESVGEVSVMPNVPLIVDQARKTALATTVGLAAQAGVVGLLVLILVYWMMSRPLAHLSGSLHRIIPGDGNRVSVAKQHRRDEIGLLTEDINVLLSTVDTMLNDERQLRHRMESLEHRFRGIFEDSSAGIFLVHEKGIVSMANPAFYHITGIDEPLPAMLATEDIIARIFADPESAHALIREAISTQQPCAADLLLATSEQKPCWVHCIFSPTGAESNAPTVEGVMYDVTQRKQEEERSRKLAQTDSLTGLLNRQMVEKTLEELAGQAETMKKGLVVMMLDLDGFKRVNDTYGHDAGDEMLKVVAERLRNCVRETDILARLGGDEFMIILDKTNSVATAGKIARKIIDLHRKPVEVLPGVWDRVGVSVGIAAYPSYSDDVMRLRRYADQAMYSVKHQGKNNYAVYDPAAKVSASNIDN